MSSRVRSSRLLAGQDPTSGDLLGRQLPEASVAGFDLTFKAPKSVSILYGIAGERVADELAVGHEAAVEEALGYLEREACRGRRGKNGVVEVDGRGFIGAAFRHRTSRAGDPLLHTHVVVANRVQGPDDRWTAPDARYLYRHAKTAGFLYQAALRAELTDRLGLEWSEVDKGTAEVTGFSREVVEHFSRRRAEIVAELEQRGQRSLQAAQTAALATRQGKDYGVPIGRLREQWRARAAEQGIDRAALDRILTPRERGPQAPWDIDLRELTRHASTFTRRDVLQALAAAHRDGAPADVIEAEADRVLRGPEIVPAITAAGEHAYTTSELVALERELLDRGQESAFPRAGRADEHLVEEAIARRELTGEQADLVRAITASDRLVTVVRAPAGAGKTYALDAAREAWVRSGTDVTGCALSARAAAELRDQAAINTTTIARLRLAVEHGHQLEWGGVLVVDEAGMVGTRDLAALAEHVDARQGRLVLVGDDRQLPEIEAGGAFRGLAERAGAHELTSVQRQRDQEDREALDALRRGDTRSWAERYGERGDLVTAPTAPALRERLVADWWQSREAGDAAVMLAYRRRDVADLNERARTRMRSAGRFAGDDVQHGERSYAVGDEVRLARNDRALQVINGDRGMVREVAAGHLDVRLGDGRDVRLPGDYAAEHLDHAYASTAHRAQGASVDRAFVLGSDEQYREWGYTAMTRHRERTRFYLTAPAPYLNREASTTLSHEELVDAAARVFAGSRRQELALEAIERHPNASRLLEKIQVRERSVAEAHALANELEAEREAVSRLRRGARRELGERAASARERAHGMDREVAKLAGALRHRRRQPAAAGPPARPRPDPAGAHAPTRARDRSRTGPRDVSRCPRNTANGRASGPFARHCGIATSSTCETAARAGYRFGMTQPTRLTAADRRRFAPIIAARVDELEAGVRDTSTVDELEDLACQASVRFQGAHVPGGAVEMLVDELTHRATPEAATMLAAFAQLGAADVALAGRQALERLGLPDAALDPRVSQLGLLRATEVRRTDLLRAQTWTLALQRSWSARGLDRPARRRARRSRPAARAGTAVRSAQLARRARRRARRRPRRRARRDDDRRSRLGAGDGGGAKPRDRLRRSARAGHRAPADRAGAGSRRRCARRAARRARGRDALGRSGGRGRVRPRRRAHPR